MTTTDRTSAPVADVFKALSDPIRWDIVRQIAAAGELPCAVLETTLPVSKPTISYHAKTLIQAGLIEVRKEGRSLFYTLNREILRSLVDDLWSLAPEPRSVNSGRIDHGSSPRRRSRREATDVQPVRRNSEGDVRIMTW